MKKLSCVLLFVAGSLFAQATGSMSSGTFSDTLKSGGKSYYIITNDYPYSSRLTVTLWTASGTDTVAAYTTTRNLSTYSQKMLIDMSSGSPVNSVIVTTTAKEYLVYDPAIYKLKLQSLHALLITLFTVSRK